MLVFESFPSVESFRAALNSRPLNAHGVKIRSSHRVERDGDEFFGTRDYEAAECLIYSGDNESASLLRRYTAQSDAFARRPQSVIERRESGFAPCVPAYLAGAPRAMFNKRTVQQPRRGAINIGYLMSAAYTTTPEELAQAGAVMLNIINALQVRGESVNLYILPFGVRDDNGDYFISAVRVLHAGQRINIARLAYMLVNSSFLRRHGFRWLETAGGVKRHISGYGIPINSSEAAKALGGVGGLGEFKLTSFKDIRAADYDIFEIAASLGVAIK